jgi:hypothetical protein
MAVFLTLKEWLNMTAMVLAPTLARVSVPYRFVSVYFRQQAFRPGRRMN